MREDLKSIRGILGQVDAELALGGGRLSERKDAVCAEAFLEIEIHAALEEEICYPAITSYRLSGPTAAVDMDQIRALVAAGSERLAQIKERILRLREQSMHSQDFDTEVLELIGDFRLFSEAEERDLYPLIERFPEPLLSVLSERMARRKQSLLSSSAREAQPTLVQDSYGGEQMRTFGRPFVPPIQDDPRHQRA
jgi:hypothetical protein